MKKPILICVDDEQSALDSITRVLRKDFEIFTATTPSQGLKLLESYPGTAIVLSDYRMPEKFGLEFLKDVKAKSPETVRALVSGQVDMHEMMKAINTGLVHKFILKPWDPEYLHLQMLESLQSFQVFRERSQLERLSNTDSITELYNHRYFQVALKREFDRALRHERPLSLLMIDIDHFKNFNDQFGHPEGDKLLHAVAGRLLEQVRNLDMVTRYGGEEFAIIMPDTGPDEAAKVAERIRAAFDQNAFSGLLGRPALITVSIGVATLKKNLKNPSELIDASDMALYQAKRQGRNQTVVAPQ